MSEILSSPQITTDRYKAIEQEGRVSLTAELDTESEEDSSSSGESDTQQQGPKTAWEIKLRKIVASISEDIRSLYRTSMLLRRPQNPSNHVARGVEFLQFVDQHRQQNVRQQFIPLTVNGPVEEYRASLRRQKRVQEAHNARAMRGGITLDEPRRFPRISRKLLDIETLEHYNIPCGRDCVSPLTLSIGTSYRRTDLWAVKRRPHYYSHGT